MRKCTHYPRRLDSITTGYDRLPHMAREALGVHLALIYCRYHIVLQPDFVSFTIITPTGMGFTGLSVRNPNDDSNYAEGIAIAAKRAAANITYLKDSLFSSLREYLEHKG